jgi:hypothetical protein
MLLLRYPLTDAKKNFIRRIKLEAKQIPKNKNGVIIINSSNGFDNYVRFAHEVLKRNISKNILAIIIWYKDNYRIITPENTTDVLDSLQIPFVNDCWIRP